ncbi:MAG: CPBP family intramembrane metalloprotease [Candidatus Nomurabacteria bacterium]|jgi:membrane protease YdiL (CAAX protease family)|nr:CPBP family intramembrane metalloprotease [Candidatus Nomurabacteria bacterium]
MLGLRSFSWSINWELLFSQLWQAAILGVIFAALYGIMSAVRKKLITRKELGLTLPKWSDIGFGLLGTIVYFIASVLLVALARVVLTFVNWDETQDVGLPNMLFGANLLIAFFFICVVTPIMEELIFRGLIFGRLRAKLGFILSATITSLIFALAHGQWNVAIDVFALSMVACGFREITGNINAGIIMHMAKNTLAFYLLFVA